MAQTQNMPVNDDLAAWLATGTALGFRVEDGQLWGGANGALYPVPPLPGFAGLGDGAKRLVLYSVAKIIDYRIGQTATGDVAGAVANFIGNSAEFKPERSCDAFESHYIGVIRGKVMAMAPDKAKTTDKHTQPDGKEVTWQSTIMTSAEKYRESQFANVVKAAIAAGRNRGSAKTTTDRKPRGTAVAAEITFE